MTPLKLGMVGGGQGAFIGGVHRIAARLDGQFTLVSGALSSDPERAHASAQELGIAANRSYSSYQEMAKAEAKRADGIDAVAIVTPNHLHSDIAQTFLAQGINVICDKPMTATLDQAQALAESASNSDAQFFLTHNYTGYPMIRHARAMIAAGELGALRMVQADYLQDWLTQPAGPDNKQASWRTDPAISGGGAIGDIGTHAFNLMNFVTSRKARSLSAELRTFVSGRKVDDDARVSLDLGDGAYGKIWASQVAVGNENSLTLKVYGEKAGLEWAQEDPNVLWITPFGQPKQKITRGGAGAGSAANAVTRVPGGHPEGYLEAFATIYADAAAAIRDPKSVNTNLIGLQDGLDGVRFVSACISSSNQAGALVSLDDL